MTTEQTIDPYRNDRGIEVEEERRDGEPRICNPCHCCLNCSLVKCGKIIGVLGLIIYLPTVVLGIVCEVSGFIHRDKLTYSEFIFQRIHPGFKKTFQLTNSYQLTCSFRSWMEISFLLTIGHLTLLIGACRRTPKCCLVLPIFYCLCVVLQIVEFMVYQFLPEVNGIIPFWFFGEFLLEGYFAFCSTSLYRLLKVIRERRLHGGGEPIFSSPSSAPSPPPTATTTDQPYPPANQRSRALSRESLDGRSRGRDPAGGGRRSIYEGHPQYNDSKSRTGVPSHEWNDVNNGGGGSRRVPVSPPSRYDFNNDPYYHRQQNVLGQPFDYGQQQQSFPLLAPPGPPLTFSPDHRIQGKTIRIPEEKQININIVQKRRRSRPRKHYRHRHH